MVVVRLLSVSICVCRSYCLLAEAYLRVQSPGKAIAAYEQALQRDPSNADLAILIGKAYVTTHDYYRAIEYYEAAVKNAGRRGSGGDAAAAARGVRGKELVDRTPLQMELAELYLKLQQYVGI